MHDQLTFGRRPEVVCLVNRCSTAGASQSLWVEVLENPRFTRRLIVLAHTLRDRVVR